LALVLCSSCRNHRPSIFRRRSLHTRRITAPSPRIIPHELTTLRGNRCLLHRGSSGFHTSSSDLCASDASDASDVFEAILCVSPPNVTSPFRSPATTRCAYYC
jgi:hypothetical protein